MRFLLNIMLSFPILTIVIILTILLNLRNRKTTSLFKRERESFWEKESLANSTRKKDLSNLHYITIPEKSLPFIETNDEIINSCHNNIHKLMTESIVNLTGYTNTELKLEYGAANLNTLSKYDSNFTELCRVLNKWGSRLLELEYTVEACTVLEFAVSILSDVSSTYKTLGRIYIQNGDSSKIDNLLNEAEKLNSLSKPVIIKALSELKNSSVS
ncbi:MAG: hypothetical protein K2I03_07145 [Lachnospiraceae bacterium]|nr:hypothetical protein [Lachnospiraceae bacterium]